MSQVIDAHREHIDKLTEINKSQALEIARLRNLKTLDDSPLLQALNTAEEEIITLREQRDSLLAALKFARVAMTQGKESGLPCKWEGFATAVWKADKVIQGVEEKMGITQGGLSECGT